MPEDSHKIALIDIYVHVVEGDGDPVYITLVVTPEIFV